MDSPLASLQTYSAGHLQGLGSGTYGVLKGPHVILMHQQD